MGSETVAASLPSPPASRESTPQPVNTPEILAERLDELLEQYLELLDTYTSLREALSKSFSSGFFSLANAQRTSNLGTARRYGQEGYDSRMKALRRVRISRTLSDNTKELGEDAAQLEAQEGNLRESLQFTIARSQHNEDGSSDKPSQQTSKPTPSKEQDGADVDTNETSNSTSALAKETKSSVKKPRPAQSDPLRWYGILVPPALRQTQGTFTTAVESTVPLLLSTMVDMQQAEREIWQLRKELGIYDTCVSWALDEHTEAHVQEEEEDNTLSEHPQPPLKPSKSTTTSSQTTGKRASLSVRAAPRSNLLKLDS